jgi:hypothetical protein
MSMNCDDGDEPLPPPTPEEERAEAWKYWRDRAIKAEAAVPPLRAREEIIDAIAREITASVRIELAAEDRVRAAGGNIEPGTDLYVIKTLLDEIHQLREVLAESQPPLSSPAGQEWRDISSAPKDEQRILGTDGVSRFVMFWRGANHLPHQDKPGWNLSGGVQRLFPTHWMPLPAPPAAERHAYVPSTLHMGDCAVCGHLQYEEVHTLVAEE